MNVQVASWSATATAFPASSAVSNTVCGQSNVAPLTQAGMSVMIRIRFEAGLEGGAVLGREPHPDRQDRERRAVPEQPIDGRLHPAGGDALDVVLAVGEQDQRRPDGIGRQVRGRPLACAAT